jgi:predicted GNAT superfamily acetyltransferase
MSATQTAIVIRDLKSLAELQAVEQLQKEVWGVDDREILPALAMIPMKHVGGVLLGAFDGAKLVGFSFAFPGFENGQLILHSDMLAVKPDYRSLGLGLQLKLAQRQQALDQGISTITWTFDPLQSLNANLNFGKLGVVSDRYFVDYYGETTSFLHSTGTDRLWVTWKLDDDRVSSRIAGGNPSEAFSEPYPAVLTIGAQEEPISSNKLDSAQLFLDIPINFNALVKENRELAVDWRAASRQAFTSALDEGFIVQDFSLVKTERASFGRYLLTKS